ncbi:MAG: zf-HC2 domain-containing protein [Planctomycetaceae bacterium]|nr:zf-HC2 domain-containing protein [Planctomycetaceae bacterium]
MPTPHSEELLSAYLDGELSPAERAEVERQLDASPELRDLLDEWSELGQSLRRLPGPSVPADFHQSLMADIVRSQPAPQRHSDPLGRHLWRFAWKAILAASVVLAVGTAMFQRIPVGNFVAMDAAPEAERNIAMERVAAPAVELASADPEAGAPFEMVAPLSRAESISPTDGEMAPVYIITKDQIREQLANLGRAPMPGNSVSVRRTTENGESPIVVDLVVVDAVDTVGQLEVLLKRQQASTPGEVIFEGVEGIESPNPKDSQLFAVYLEMDGPHMAELLNNVPALDAAVFVEESSGEATMLEQQSLASRGLGSRSPEFPSSNSLKEEVPIDEFRSRQAGNLKGRARKDQVRFDFQAIVASQQPNSNPTFPATIDQPDGALSQTRASRSVAESSPAGTSPVPAAPNAVATTGAAPPSPTGLPSSKDDEFKATALSQDWAKAKRLKAILLLRQPDPPRTPEER